MPEVAKQTRRTTTSPAAKRRTRRFKLTPCPACNPAQEFVALTVAANFVEVFFAKEGHAGLVGINFLEKIQFPTLPSLSRHARGRGLRADGGRHSAQHSGILTGWPRAKSSN